MDAGSDVGPTRGERTVSPYQYVVLRCVPRVDREEFLNVGVVLFCQDRDLLDVAWALDEPRLLALDPGIDPAAVEEALRLVALICAGDPRAGAGASGPQRERFGLLAAPRSTVVQPGPVHGGLTDDPDAALADLLLRLVG